MVVNVNPFPDVSKLCVTCASLTMGSDEVRVFEIFADDALVGPPGNECPPSYLNDARACAIPPEISLTSINTLF